MSVRGAVLQKKSIIHFPRTIYIAITRSRDFWRIALND